MYKGPDEKYLGRDICYSYNEDTLTIYDVTDPTNSSIISVTSYQGATYTHQASYTYSFVHSWPRLPLMGLYPKLTRCWIGMGSRPRVAGVPDPR